jgi:hypothetical protein
MVDLSSSYPEVGLYWFVLVYTRFEHRTTTVSLQFFHVRRLAVRGTGYYSGSKETPKSESFIALYPMQ